MNAIRHNSDNNGETYDDGLARHIATVVASLVSIAFVAVGGTLYTFGTAGSERNARLVIAEREIVELHGYVEGLRQRFDTYPSSVDLGRCSSRLQALEEYAAVDKHRVEKIEQALKQ